MFHGFVGVFEANSNKKAIISSKLSTGDSRISHCLVFETILSKEVAQKLNKKLRKKVEKT